MANAYAPTYTGLVAEIQDICENTNSEFVLNIPRFIARAQDQVQRDHWYCIVDEVDSITTAITTTLLTRDPDWLIVRSLWLPVQAKFMEQRHPDYVRQYGGLGRPRFWAEESEGTLLIAPTPNTSYPVQVAFYERLAALTVDNPSNWLTNNAGDLLLLLCLAHASDYLMAPERATQMMGVYQQVLPTAVSEIRDSERQRNAPVRSAPRPVMQAGASA